MTERRAKIMATLGPASSSREVLGAMLDAGLDVVRLNLSHGEHENHRQTIRLVRELATERRRFIPIVLDLMGPRYRLGVLPDGGTTLDQGQRVRLVAAPGGSGLAEAEDEEGPDGQEPTREELAPAAQAAGGETPAEGSPEEEEEEEEETPAAGVPRGERSADPDPSDEDLTTLPLGDPELLDHLQAGERVLIDNGLVELTVERVDRAGLTARVVHGGRVSTRKGINLPDTSVPFVITPKDRADIAFAVQEDVDYLAASYVHRKEDLEALQREVGRSGGRIPLIAKLERSGSIDRLEELVHAADAVMVARGDLGVEVPLHRVPVLQKEIIAAGRRLGKPVIVATQMLESMMSQPRPTRAEASDVANAVFDGADALMLSGETAAGSFPVKAIEVMAQVIVEAEDYDRKTRAPAPTASLGIASSAAGSGGSGAADALLQVAEVVCAAAVYATQHLPVRRIVAFSQGGFTARMVARNRPAAPILVFTTSRRVARRIQLVWGVRPLIMETEVEHHDEVVQLVEQSLLQARLVAPGETIVTLMGDPIKARPLTNLMRVHRLREAP